ncbi:MAG: hypothetical protein ABIJ41_00985 [Candidatus Omnitrophota bacterium]
MFSNRLKEETGVILVTVIILTIVMMIVTIGVISTNYSQAIYTQHQIERIKAEQIGKGVAWYNYMNEFDPGSATPLPSTVTLDGKTYTITHVPTANAGPNNTDLHTFDITY